MVHLLPAHAVDSQLSIVTAIFNGGSYAVTQDGEPLGKLSAADPGWHIIPLQSLEFRAIRKSGRRWNPKLGNRNLRNLGAYHLLVDPATRPTWTQVFLDEYSAARSPDRMLRRFRCRTDANDSTAYRTPPVAFDAPWTSHYRVDPNHPTQVVNREEGPSSFLTTVWACPSCHHPEDVLPHARDQGVSLIGVALGGRPIPSTQLNLQLPNGTHRLGFLRPAYLAPLGAATFQTFGHGTREAPSIPPCSGDLLVHIERLRRESMQGDSRRFPVAR